MSIADTKLLTAEELFALPAPGGERYELIEGELHTMSPPGFDHGEYTSTIAAALAPFVREHGLGHVAAGDPGFLVAQQPDTVLAPDVAYLSNERYARRGDRAYPALAPDLAVEVVSPGDRFTEVETKAQTWLEHGTREVWVVHPERRVIYVYADSPVRREYGAGDDLETPLLPGFALPVGHVFAGQG